MSGYDDEITVALTANATELQEGMAQATASIENMQATVAQEAAAFNAAVQTKVEAMTRLNAAFAAGVSSAEGIAEAESALDQAMNAGAITAGEYAGYVATLDAAEAAMTTTAEAATAALVEQNAAMSISGGVAREVGVMIGELARGNYTRLEGSTITLANRTGLLSTALNAVLSPLGLVAVAAAAIGYSVFEAGQDFEKMEGDVLATGQAAGLTAGQLVSMADRIGESTGSIGNATEAIQKLALSGRFAGHDLQLVATAAADMAALTGESIESCVSQIEKLQEDPLKAVAKLNDQFHFLTVSQYEQMEQLQKSGDTMGAAQVAYEAMASSMQSRTDTLNTHVNVLVSTFRKLKTAWSEDMQAMDVALGGGDNSEQLAVATNLLDKLKEQDKEAQQMGSGALPGITAQLERQTQIVNDMVAKFHGQETAAAAVGQAAQKSAAQIDDMAKKLKSGNGDTQAAQADRERYEQMEIDRNLSLQQERDYWTQIKNEAKEGSAEYRQALEQLVEVHRKEGEAAKEAARQSVEARKQASAATMNDLEVQREETVTASQARIQIDEQIVQNAEKLYGEDSAQYKRAVAEKISDTKAFANAQIEEAKKAEEEVEAIYKKQNDAAIKAVDEMYTARVKESQSELTLAQVTAAQQIAMMREYANQEYQTDLDILEHYRDMMAGKPNVVAAINAQIEQLEQKHAATMAQIDQKAAQQQYQTWTQYLNPISHAFDTAVNGMIQGTQTWHQVTQRILSSVLSSYIEMGVQMVKDWIAREAAKVTATVASTGQQTSITDAARASNTEADQATSQASVARAAGVAGANGVASFAGAPWPIDIGAPAFGASMSAAASGFGSVASAAGGWDRVPFDDAPALLHRNEMVLPAHLAENVRNMSGGGGGGSTQNIHVHANDAKSFEKMLSNNPNAFAKAARRALGKGGRR